MQRQYETNVADLAESRTRARTHCRMLIALVTAINAAAGCASSRLGEYVLPAQRVKDYFIVECKIDGEGPFSLLLDTGSSWVGLSPDAAAQIGRGSSQGIYRLGTVRMGDLVVRSLDADTINMSLLSATVGVPLDGILSFSAFKDVILILDYPAHEVRGITRLPDVFRTTPAMPTGPYDRPFIHVDIQGRRSELLIDSGAGGHFALTSLVEWNWESEPVDVGVVATAYGDRPRLLGRLQGTMEIGAMTVSGPMVELAHDVSFVGAAILREGKIAFDQSRRLAWFQTETEGPFRAPSYRGTGLVTRQVGDHLVVAGITAGSAKRAGVQVGDRVTAINGTSIPNIRRGAEAPSVDGRIRIELQRGDQTLQFEFEIEILVR